MTANQRRPGFRLPWSSETDEPAADAAPGAETVTTPAAHDPATEPTPVTGRPAADQATSENAAAAPEGEASEPPKDMAQVTSPVDTTDVEPSVEADLASGPQPESSPDFLRDLVGAMRSVADRARETNVAELRARADEHVRRLEADAERRRDELRTRAEADVAGVGEWAKAEAERIKAEAEQRVAARRAQLEQQLSAEGTRTEAESQALRARVEEYERELEAYHAQLAEISDPAAFAAAAKRMPPPPRLEGAAAPAPTGSPNAGASATPASPGNSASNGVEAQATAVHPAEEEVLAARLAELDSTIAADESGAGAAESASAAPVTTDIVVKGLGSFGAITGFRQSLAGVDGISGVALSLGQTGEFVFRATHEPAFDVSAAITALEGDAATIESKPEGGLRVTLDRTR